MEEVGSVLVTGGAGYIGSHTVRALRAVGRDVVVLDSLELGAAEAVLDAQLVVGDISDRELVRSVLGDFGVTDVVHFAAYKSVGESMESAGKYWRNNVAGTVELLEACRGAQVERFVFSSSCSVYGTPAEVPVTETAAIAPESVYAETKATVERMLRWYGVTDGLRSVSLRYFNAAGASADGRIGEDWAYSINLIPLAMKAVLLGDRRLQVFRNGRGLLGTRRHSDDGTGCRKTGSVRRRRSSTGRPCDDLRGPDAGEATARLVRGTWTRPHRRDCVRLALQPDVIRTVGVRTRVLSHRQDVRRLLAEKVRFATLCGQ